MEGPDRIDIQLLKELQKNARISVKELSRRVFLSSPAASSRLSRLEREGYIQCYTVREDEFLLGYPIKGIIGVRANRKGRDRILSFVEQCPNVVECDFVTGDICMVITVFFENTQKMDLFIGEIQRLGGETKTQIVCNTPIKRRGIRLPELPPARYTAHVEGSVSESNG